ncbi:MAG: outer membrane beta-barrel protein [Bacteroidales bacterium]|nr:outer membrane beta-barrel protein [Bacteroidales bacterium]
MKKILLLFLAFLLFAVPKASAQLGFDFGMNFEMLSRKVPEGFKSGGFGMGPYAGIIYGIPVSMSGMVNLGINYKYDILWGAMGAWYDETKLDVITLGNYDTSIREHHLQLPVSFNYGTRKGWSFFAGPVLDYCLASTTSSTDKDWPFKDENGKGMKMNTIKDLGIKPFNVYLKAGGGVGTKGFSFKLTAAYGLLNLAPDKGSPLHRWTVGMDFHINL